MTLTQDQIEFYRKNGYLLLENVIARETIEKIRTVVNGFIDKSRSAEASDAVYDLDPGHSADNPCVRRLKDPHTLDPVFFDLSRDNVIVDAVAALLGGTVRFDHSKLNFKPTGSDASIQWHQDWAFYPYTNDDLLAVGVMIEDCTETNGPLMVVPGSHKGPVYDHHLDGWFAGGISDETATEFTGEAVNLTGKAGSITLHHVRTLHASANNLSDRERPLLLFGYAAVDAFPVFDRYDLEEFNSRILRGEPVVEGRMEPAPVRLPWPRKPGADSIYDNQAELRSISAQT